MTKSRKATWLLEEDPALAKGITRRVFCAWVGQRAEMTDFLNRLFKLWERHRAGTAIKAVTFHKFFVKQSPTGWVAEVFLDV